MKKSLHYVTILGIAALLLASCQSTQQETPAEKKQPAQKEHTLVVSQKEDSERAIKQQLTDMSITVSSFPKQTLKGKNFPEPYKIHVSTQSGEPLKNVKIVAQYPSARSNETLSFAKETLVTDENGNAVFMPETPQFSVKSEVSFFPYVESSNPEISKLCTEATVTAPWAVRTNETARTWILVSIVDYKLNGAMNVGSGSQPSTQALTAVLWNNGLTGAQNADFRNSVNADDPKKINAEAIKLTRGNAGFKYVVYGRVKYAGDITQDADKLYNVTFNGEVSALDLKSGEVVFKAVKTVTVKDKSQWNAIDRAQKEMAAKFGEEVIYGL